MKQNKLILVLTLLISMVSLNAFADNVTFADSNVKAICVNHWDTNGDGEISLDEAAAVTTLSDYFKNNTSITSFDELIYFTGLTGIGNFAWCSNLSSIKIPNTVTTIGTDAFAGCGLTSFTLPKSVVVYGDGPEGGLGALKDCRNLTSIMVEDGNTKYDSRENCNAIIETATNTLVSGCKNTVIPKTVTSIGYQAFRGSDISDIEIPNSVTSIGYRAFWYASLTSVKIPGSVTKIGDYAFDCSSLTSVSIAVKTPLIITETTFSNKANTTLYVPVGSKAAYEAAD